MSRAERAMELTAKLHIANRLKEIGNTTGDTLGTSHRSETKWIGGSVLREMRDELTELKRQMGGSERREFERLLSKWRGSP